MRKIMVYALVVYLLLSCVACNQADKQPVKMEPQVSQMKAICELATMECYYHNVAKYFEKDADKGFLGIGKKDKHFWIEYSGVVRLGIDVSLVKVDVNDTQIAITIPEAKVLDCKVDSASLSSDSFIVDKNSAAVSGDDEVKAFGEAQAKLKENAASNRALLDSAQQRAMALLEEYMLNIGSACGKQYTIKWIYVDADGKSVETEAE